MYLSKLMISNFRCFGSGNDQLELCLNPGLTALVGENDAGKTAIIDAVRLALGTTDQEWFRLEASDFYVSPGGHPSREIRICCKFAGLTTAEMGAFAEYLTYEDAKYSTPILYIHWSATDTGETIKGRPYRRVEINSGKNADGPSIESEVREMLRATYLRPLRDAEQALSSGRGSRLAQIMKHTAPIKVGSCTYEPDLPLGRQTLSVLAIGKLLNELLGQQEGIQATRTAINRYLTQLSLHGEPVKSSIAVRSAGESDEALLRQLLEKLDLLLDTPGKPGLGSNNLLFIACELLLLVQDAVGSKLLLIEEPEAHLHSQRQLRSIHFLQTQAKKGELQVLLTTHSPNIASAIALENLVMIQGGRCYPMSSSDTKLEKTDYRFLERFLDATKANLFFARAVLIVEGDAESILLPTLAKLLDRDFIEYGVSIVNVGGVGLRRYARIFMRANSNASLNIPVACVTDLDVMPDCAPAILGKVGDDGSWPPTSGGRKWRAKQDFPGGLDELRKEKIAKASEQSVQTFVSDDWTLEYNLALGSGGREGLGEEVFVAACLALKDDQINAGLLKADNVKTTARSEYADLKANATSIGVCSKEEVLATRVYAKYTKEKASVRRQLSFRVSDN